LPERQAKNIGEEERKREKEKGRERKRKKTRLVYPRETPEGGRRISFPVEKSEAREKGENDSECLSLCLGKRR